jgi:hypothetical protein
VYQLSEAEAICLQILQLDPANAEVPFLLNALPGRRGDAIAARSGEPPHTNRRKAAAAAEANAAAEAQAKAETEAKAAAEKAAAEKAAADAKVLILANVRH